MVYRECENQLLVLLESDALDFIRGVLNNRAHIIQAHDGQCGAGYYRGGAEEEGHTGGEECVGGVE